MIAKLFYHALIHVFTLKDRATNYFFLYEHYANPLYILGET